MAEKENFSPRNRVTEYMDYATAHGIGRVKNSPYVALKIVWVLAVLGSITMLSIQLTRITDKWKKYPINTKIELQTPESMRFPAVTVCNLNPLRYSYVQRDAVIMPAVQVAAKKWGINLNEFEEDNIYNGTSYNFTEEFTKFQTATGTGKNPSDMIEYFRIKASAENPEKIANYSHQLQNLVVSCTFNGMTCDRSFFKVYRSYEYGMCNTYGLSSENMTVEDYFQVYAPGKDHGLTMILNAEQEEYLPFITDSAGLIITVHSPENIPYAREEGIIVSPGFNTEVAVTVDVQDRIPGRTQRCDPTSEYNLVACQRRCLEEAIKKECGCSIDVNDFVGEDRYHFDYDDYDSDNMTDSVESQTRLCDPQNDTLCILQTRLDQGIGLFSCANCIIPCQQIRYLTSVATTVWPAETYRPVLEKILKEYSSDSIFSVVDVRENMAQVKIYLPTFTKHTLIEEEAYTDENYVSDIGGQLGLWIGFSVLSLCELVELVILLVSSCCSRKVKPLNKKSEKDEVLQQ